MIQLSQIHKYYHSGNDTVHALRDVNVEIKKGENVVVIGKSGSGKSTFLNIISGIDRPSEGEIIVNGTHLNKLNENDLSLWRGRNIGIVFQFYQLIPTLTAFDNVLFAMDLVNKVPKKARKNNAAKFLDDVGLHHKITKFPNELSGGERQRVAIARAMANQPEMIIADEPTGNLDSKTGEQIVELFEKLNKEGTTIITVTHANISDKKYDRVLNVVDGMMREKE